MIEHGQQELDPTLMRIGSTGSLSSVGREGSRPKSVKWRLLQLLIFGGGIWLLVWAFSDARFRDAEGYLRGQFCLPLSLGVALMILGTAVVGPLRRSVSWFALALVGQAVTLQLIDAGSTLRYQHYKPIARILIDAYPFLPLFIAVQTALVVVGLKVKWRSIRTWVRRTFKVWQLLGIGLVFVLASTAVSRDMRAYAAELPLAVFLQCVNLANIVLAVWALPTGARFWLAQKLDLLFGSNEEVSGRPQLERFVVVAAVWVVVVAALLSYFAYERHPHIADEVAYLYQARYFAAGMLHMPVPTTPEGFQIPLLQSEAGRWYSVFPPGWPLALAVGVLLGVPWLVNPLLAGLNVLLSYFLIARLYDRRSARIAVFLLCVSPWHVLMSMNFMSHTFTLTVALAASLLLLRAGSTGRARWAALAGAGVGFVALIRPLDGVILAALLGLCAVGFCGRRLKLSSIAALVLGSVLIGAAVLPYNKWLTGDPTLLPVTVYFDKHYWPNSNAFCFGPERGAGWAIDAFPGHSPLEGLINTNLNTFSINSELFGWSTGSLILVGILVFGGAIRFGEFKKSDRPMFVAIGLSFAAHFFYYFSGGPDFGARYWYLMLVPAVVLTVRGIQFLETKLRSLPRSSTSSVSILVTVAVLALSTCTVVNFFPWRAIDKYHHYWGMRPDIRHLAGQYGFGRSLVLVRGNNFPDYASAAVYNPVDLSSDVPIYAWDKDAETRKRLLRDYSDRPVWFVDAPSLTNGGYRVVSGPLPAGDLDAAINEHSRQGQHRRSRFDQTILPQPLGKCVARVEMNTAVVRPLNPAESQSF
jgi:hypothetical protein